MGTKYEVVQAYRPEFCPPPMPHAIPTNVTYLVDEGPQTFFCFGPRTGASGEACPHRLQAF